MIAGDVRDPRFCDKAVKQVAKAFGGIDILVNNAAFQLHCERLEDLEDAHLQETLQTNIGGYIQMARAVLPHLGEGASIINTGSETGIFGSKALIDYSATKGAIHAFTKSLASQLLPRGIRVNCVAPGPVWTPLNPADKQAEDVAQFGKDSDMGRPAQPEELSPAYVFLASPACASYISGVILPVMGGPRGERAAGRWPAASGHGHRRRIEIGNAWNELLRIGTDQVGQHHHRHAALGIDHERRTRTADTCHLQVGRCAQYRPALRPRAGTAIRQALCAHIRRRPPPAAGGLRSARPASARCRRRW